MSNNIMAMVLRSTDRQTRKPSSNNFCIQNSVIRPESRLAAFSAKVVRIDGQMDRQTNGQTTDLAVFAFM